MAAFIDEAEIEVRAGRGGHGIVCFRREKYVPKGGPDGGNGGRGGDVILAVDPQLSTLYDLHALPVQKAEDARSGGPNRRTGHSGRSLRLPVPLGCAIYDADSEEKLVELTRPGQRAVVAHGGAGGRGNGAFVTSTRQAPRYREKGEPGEVRRLRLELKLLADIGLVGMPNAGKSSLLSRVTAARPKIADYPFTTLQPVLGIYRPVRGKSYVLADIPGLIEGAHAGHGLGDTFLRHIERTQVVIHLVDLSSVAQWAQEDVATPEARDPLGDYRVVKGELTAYARGLADKPQIVALNKIDLVSDGQVSETVAAFRTQGVEAFPVSALIGNGLGLLMARAAAVVDEVRSASAAEAAPEEEFHIHIPRRETQVRRLDDRQFAVEGSDPERAVAIADLSTPEGILHLHRMLERMKVLDRLAALGACAGDTVRIGPVELEYSDAADVLAKT